jgi:hypothetical protein
MYLEWEGAAESASQETCPAFFYQPHAFAEKSIDDESGIRKTFLFAMPLPLTFSLASIQTGWNTTRLSYADSHSRLPTDRRFQRNEKSL